MSPTPQTQSLLDALCRRGVICVTTVRYWRGCKKLRAEDLGLSSDQIDDRLFQLGQKRLVPREALSRFALLESRVNAAVESASFPFLNGMGRFVPATNIESLHRALQTLAGEFHAAASAFHARYPILREEAMGEWEKAAARLPHTHAARLLATIREAFPPAEAVHRKFGFQHHMLQIAIPEQLETRLLDHETSLFQQRERQRILDEAANTLQSELDTFVRQSVITLRAETVQLIDEVLATIDARGEGVHQRTLNRLTDFIQRVRRLNFVGDRELETHLDQFRAELLTRSAGDYREDADAFQRLTGGLHRLRDQARDLLESDPSHILEDFAQLGHRRLAC